MRRATRMDVRVGASTSDLLFARAARHRPVTSGAHASVTPLSMTGAKTSLRAPSVRNQGTEARIVPPGSRNLRHRHFHAHNPRRRGRRRPDHARGSIGDVICRITSPPSGAITSLLILGILFAVLLADVVGRIRLQVFGFISCAVGLFLASLSTPLPTASNCWSSSPVSCQDGLQLLLQFIVPAFEMLDPVQCIVDVSGMSTFGTPMVVASELEMQAAPARTWPDLARKGRQAGEAGWYRPDVGRPGSKVRLSVHTPRG